MLSPSIGMLTYALRGFGIDWNYYVNPGQALLLICVAAIWKQISYNFLFFLAGLQAIPPSLIEAAAIDGAGPVRRFWTIVFPLLSPTAFFLLVVNVVYAFFDTFAIVDSTTQGGPGQATQILVFKIYQDGVQALDLGGSAAQSVVLMVIVIALTVVQFRCVERKVQYCRVRARAMIERRPFLNVVRHAVLIVAVGGDPVPGLRRLRRLDAVVRPGAARADAAVAREPPARELRHRHGPRQRARARARRSAR